MLKCNDLSVNIGGKTVLERVSFELAQNTFTAVVGKNGSGKSTLSACIQQQIKYEGNITLDGRDLSSFSPKERAVRIASLPQTLLSPGITVGELTELGRSPHLGINKRLSEKDREITKNALMRTDMERFKNRLLPSLSGGEKQRAYLSMILAQDTDILVLDEPTTYMDIHAEAEFLRLLQSLTKEGKTLMVILHNLSLAARYAENIIVLDNHTCVFSGTRKDCIENEIFESVFNVRKVETKSNGKNEIFYLA